MVADADGIGVASLTVQFQAMELNARSKHTAVMKKAKRRRLATYSLAPIDKSTIEGKIQIFDKLWKCLFTDLGYEFSYFQNVWARAFMNNAMVPIFQEHYDVCSKICRAKYQLAEGEVMGKLLVQSSRRAGKTFIFSAIGASLIAVCDHLGRWEFDCYSPSGRQSSKLVEKVFLNVRRIPWVDQKQVNFRKTDIEVWIEDPRGEEHWRCFRGLPSNPHSLRGGGSLFIGTFFFFSLCLCLETPTTTTFPPF